MRSHSRANPGPGSAPLAAFLLLFAAGAGTVCPVSGCARSGTEHGPAIQAPSRPSTTGDLAPSPRANAAERPAASVDGAPITWDNLRPALVEAAGAVALEEAALDALLSRELASRGLRWADLDTAHERAVLVEHLADSAGAHTVNETPADRGERLLAQLRAARGLGESRFAGLLRRNAALRALVRDDVTLNESIIRQTYELRYGPRIPARIIVVDTVDDAAQVLDRLDAGEPFGEVAALLSTDQSASRGGLLEPISPADPTYPATIRDTLRTLDPGARSNPVALERGVAILLRERDAENARPPAPSIEEARPGLRREARLRQERILMGEKARELLERARVTAFDPALNRAWKSRVNPDG